jgi:outer membrane protein
MKRIWILATIGGLLGAQMAAADNLLQIYEKAVISDPGIREAEANRMATQQGKPIARGALLPQISGSYDWQKSDSSGSNTFGQAVDVDNDPSTPPIIAILNRKFEDAESTSNNWSLNLSQSVFNWDRWVQLDQAKRSATQADVQYEAAQQELMVRVSEAYFNVLAAEDTLASEQGTKESIGRQLEQAQKRFEVGLIAITDVEEAQAAYDRAVAAEILAKRNLANTKEALRAIVDEYPANLARLPEEIPLAAPVPADENKWVDTAMQQNRDVVASQIATAIAKGNVSLARTGHYPTVEFVAFYADNDSTGDQLTGFSGETLLRFPTDNNSTQQAYGLQFSLPIFSGGTTSAQVEQAVYLHRASREALEKTIRETVRQTRDSYLAVISEMSRVEALKQSLESSRTALKATEAGYDVGTRTPLDVLESKRNLLVAETNYLRSRYDYLLNGLRLKQAAGTLTTEDIARVNGLLKN